MPHTMIALSIVAQDAPAGQPGFGNILPFILLLFVAFYFIIIRPQRKQESQRKQLLEGVKKGDEVQTIGGILGTVLSVDQNENIITLEVDKNCKMRLTRSAISTVLESKSKGAQGKKPS